MKIYFPTALIGVICLLFTLQGFGQHTQHNITPPLSFSDLENTELIPYSVKWSIPGLVSDRPTKYRPPRPYLSLPVSSTSLVGTSYWMGSVTTQSFNQGKFGRFYYWDIQGNLRGSNLFLDIAGKNKRGLKLVFPRHR